MLGARGAQTACLCLLTACTASHLCDTGNLCDTGSESAPIADLALTKLAEACDTNAQLWTYSADANGWTLDGFLRIARKQADGSYWTEEHNIRSTDACADQSCDHLQQHLDVVEDWHAQKADQSTYAKCDDLSSIAWRVDIKDLAGEVVACAVRGDVPTIYDSGEYALDAEKTCLLKN